jgi:hypothetical protein
MPHTPQNTPEPSNNLKLFAKIDNNLYAKIRHKAIETHYFRLFVALFTQFVAYVDVVPYC